jgi:S-formylglutathione hydrolase FrmB
VYLLNSALGDQDEYLTATDLIDFTGTLPRAQRAIVVLPFGGLFGFYSDWRDGSQRWESFHIRRLIPHVDASYRTLARRSQRAVAGFSMGGFGAMSYAARHPRKFAAAGSFSGVLDPVAPLVSSFVPEFVDLVNSVCDRDDDPFGIWGDPSTDEVLWRDHDPTDLAPNLRGTSLYFTAGTSTPCEPDELAENPLGPQLEEQSRVSATNFQAALRRARVPHEARFRPCGTHVHRYVERDLHKWWPRMTRALGRRAPSSFDHRRAEPAFAIRGWSFRADPRRAVEFLDIRRASKRGLTLTGSGSERVTTARYFAPGQRVIVRGGKRARSVEAGGRGRLAFSVDLGPPHLEQQYTHAARLAGQDSAGYFKTRRIRFTPRG